VVIEHDALVAGGAFESIGPSRALAAARSAAGQPRFASPLEPDGQFSHVAFEEPRPRRDELFVTLGVHCSHARPEHLFDVVEQARSPQALMVEGTCAWCTNAGEKV